MTNDLPPGWARAALKDLISGRGVFSDGDWVESKDQDPSGDVRLIQLADVGVGEFRNRSNRFLTSMKAKELNCTYLEPRDVLVARMPDPLGRACMFPSHLGPCVTVVDVAILRPGSEFIDPAWLMWSINSPQCGSQIAALQSGTTRKRISRKNLATIELTIPPILEQQRIVAAIEERLSRLDAVEAVLLWTLDRLQVFRTAVLHNVFATPLRNAQDFECAQLEHLLSHTIGGVWGKAPGEDEQDVDVARVTELRDHGSLSLDTAARRSVTNKQLLSRRLEHGDLILEKSGGGPQRPVGRVARFKGHSRDAICTNFMQLLRPDDSRIDSAFLNWQLHYRYLSGYTASMNKGSGNLRNLHMESYLTQPIWVPTLVTQRSMCTQIDESYASVYETEQSVQTALERVSALRSSILIEAFAGRLVPQNPDNEPASSLLERIATSHPTLPRRRRTIA